VTLNGVNTHFAQARRRLWRRRHRTFEYRRIERDQPDSGACDRRRVALNPTTIVVITGTEEAVLPNGFLFNERSRP